MDSWESDIQKKTLAARPFEAQANWEKMEAMLDEPIAGRKALFMRGKQYWLIAAALLMLFGATSALTIWRQPARITPLASDAQHHGEEMQNDTANNPADQAKSSFVDPEVKEIFPEIRRVERVPFFAYQGTISAPKVEPLNLTFASSLTHEIYKINRLPTPYMPKGSHSLSLNAQLDNSQTLSKGRRVVKDLRIGMYLTQDKVRRAYEFDNSSYTLVHTHAGFGVGLMKRIRKVWEAGIRLEIAEMIYYVTDDGANYSDLAGNESRAKLNLRRYLRKDVSKKIQPYVGLSSGVSRASLDLYQVSYLEPAQPSEESAARKSDDNPILPDGYVQYYNALNQLPDYQITVNRNANQYLRWENSLQFGTDIRLRPRLSLNFELGAKVATMLSGQVMVLNVLENQSFQMQQNIGLQYAF